MPTCPILTPAKKLIYSASLVTPVKAGQNFILCKIWSPCMRTSVPKWWHIWTQWIVPAKKAMLGQRWKTEARRTQQTPLLCILLSLTGLLHTACSPPEKICKKPVEVALVGAWIFYNNFLKLRHSQVHIEVARCSDGKLLHKIVAKHLQTNVSWGVRRTVGARRFSKCLNLISFSII